MLCVCLGNPPEKFDWQTRDKKNKFIVSIDTYVEGNHFLNFLFLNFLSI